METATNARGPAPARQQSTALARRGPQSVGTYRDPSIVTEWLSQAQDDGHLVSPATACGSLPEGCEVALSAVQIDVARETYNIPGKAEKGLAKVALDRIAAAAGVSWDMSLTGRLDDGRDPRRVHYRAVAVVRSFDGSARVISGEIDLDLREGAPEVVKVREREEKKKRELEGKNQRYDGDFGEQEIRQARSFILRLAESKAKNRAIRSLGVRTSYTPDELKKPFLVARLMFTGRTSDPRLREMFALGTMGAMLGGQAALYGAPSTTRALAAAIDVTPNGILGGGAPVIEPTVTEDDPPPPRQAPAGNGGSRRPPQDPPQERRQAEPDRRQETGGNAGGRPAERRIDTTQFFVPFGNDKGTPISEASEQTLDYLAGAVARNVDDPDKSRFRAKNQALLDAIHAEIEYRSNAGPGLPFDDEGHGDEQGDY